MFVATFGPGMSVGGPDMCKTPPLGVPAPLPNNALNMMALPAYFTILTTCMPDLTMGATVMLSNGDEAGALGGVVSQIIVGPCRCTVPSTAVFVGGVPVWRSTAVTVQNLANCPGVTSVPSQGLYQVTR